MTQKKIMLVLTIVLVFGILFYYFFYTSVKKFGTIVGTFDGVPAYSNQKGQTNSDDANYINGVYTGTKWQCVEYARRYLQTARGITFSNVDNAVEIPSAEFTTLDGTNLLRKTNDLKVGSLVIWPKHYKYNAPYGHVAVVSKIMPNGIYVAEQNYDDKTFPRFIDYDDLQGVTIIYPV
jgi:glutathionylspermidine amidase/synthetase